MPQVFFAGGETQKHCITASCCCHPLEFSRASWASLPTTLALPTVIPLNSQSRLTQQQFRKPRQPCGSHVNKWKWGQSDSNAQPSDLESDALPLRHSPFVETLKFDSVLFVKNPDGLYTFFHLRNHRSSQELNPGSSHAYATAVCAAMDSESARFRRFHVFDQEISQSPLPWDADLIPDHGDINHSGITFKTARTSWNRFSKVFTNAKHWCRGTSKNRRWCRGRYGHVCSHFARWGRRQRWTKPVNFFSLDTQHCYLEGVSTTFMCAHP